MGRSSICGAVAALVAAAALAAAGPGCSHASSPPPPAKTLTHAQLLDPTSCQECHGAHYGEWSGSMHAYATDDPLFVAMNARAQRDTGGAIGTFCVQCHAPMAVRTGATDGTNVASIPPALRGVTCYFCHSTTGVTGANDAPLTLGTDDVLRGGIPDPVANSAHESAYSALHDHNQAQSASLCGACHDVTLTSGVAIERTYAEWQGGLFAHDDTKSLLTCSACHMPGSDGTAANLPNMPMRRVNDHSVPGVDLALIDFPNLATQASEVQANLDPTLVAKMCVAPPTQGDTLSITLDAAFVGHQWPSGAVHDRRAWVEVDAYQAGQIVFQSGVVPPGTSVDALADPNLWKLGETLTDAQGQPVLFMWQAATTTNEALSVAVTADAGDPRYFHSTTRTYPVPPGADRIDMKVHMVPMALEVIDSLVASGDLDPAYKAKLPTFTLAGTTLEWTSAKGFGCVP